MGLDMYLSKRTYVGNKWNKPSKQVKVLIPKNKKLEKYLNIKNKRISNIEEEIGYWRKANHIHKWFVDNVQDGNDDCKEYNVSQEKLEALLSVCKEVVKDSKLVKGKIQNGYSFEENGTKKINWVDGKYIKDPTTAKKLLPCVEGFFFGGTEYDEYYLDAIKETIKIINKLFKEKDEKGYIYAEIYYSSSW